MTRLLIVAAFVLLLGGGFFAMYQINRPNQDAGSDEATIEQAREAFADEDYEQVVMLLENSANNSTIAAIKEDAELLRMYVTARESQPLYNDQHLARLVTPLTSLMQLEPDEVEHGRKLIEAYLTLDRNDEALKLTQQLSAQYPDDTALLRQLAQAQLRQNNYQDALSTLRASVKQEPLHVPTHAQILDLIESYDLPVHPFIEQAEQVYANDPDDPRAMMIRSLALATEGDGIQANELLKKASAIEPANSDMVPLLAQWLDEAGMYAIATRYIMQHAEQGLETPQGRMAIYRAFESADNKAILARLEGSNPQLANTDLLGMWVNAHLQSGSMDQADDLLKELKQRDNAIASTWLTLIELDQQDQTTPAQTIDSIVAALESNEDDLIQAMAQRHPYFMQRLGQAYLEALEPESAYAALSVAANNSDSWPRPHLDLAQTLIKLGHFRSAVVHAREAQVRDNNAESIQWLVLGMAGAANPSDSNTVDRVLSEADKLPHPSPEAERVLPSEIDLLLRAERTDEAKQRLNDALNTKDTLSAETFAALMRISLVHELGMDDAIAKQCEAQHGVTPALTLTQAFAKAESGDPEQGRTLLEQATPSPATKPWQTAMAEYLATRQPEQAGTYLSELAEQYPDDLSLQLAALQSSKPSEQTELFAKRIERLRTLAGESTINWRLQQARMSMEQSAGKQSLRETAELLRQAESFSPVHLQLRIVLSRCYMMLDDNAAAAESAKAAKSIASRNNPQVALLHGMAMHRLKRYEEARLDLIPLANSPQADPSTRIQACIMLNEQGETKTVQRAIEQLRSRGQANNEVLTILAIIYRDQGQFAKVDAVCGELMKTPDAATVRFISAYYHQTNRPDLAEQAILSARTAGISEADALMLKAEDAAQSGQADAALKLIEQAADKEADQTKRWTDATQLALSLARPSEAVRLAKRGIERTDNHTGLQSVVQHASLIEQIKDDRALIPMAVTILNQIDNHEQAVQALKITKELGASKPAAIALADLARKHPDFRYLSELACDKLLRSDLNAQAFSLAKSAMARFNNSDAVARVATLSAYRLEDWSSILTAANAWAERAPRDRMNADLMRAAASNKLGRFNTTIKTLAPYIKAETEIIDSNRLMFDYYTQALVRTGQTADAFKLLRPNLNTSEQAQAIAVKRISEDLGQADAAAAWVKEVEAISKDTKDRFAVAVASFIAGQRLNDDALVRNADQAITKLLENPGPLTVDMHYAKGQIAQRLGNNDQAVTSYRKVIAKVPDNPLVLNNLALVLTEQGGDALSEAEQLATTATKLSSKDPNLLDTLAFVHLRREQLDQAMKAIEKAIDLDESNPAWRLTQADILEAMGENDRAQVIREQYTPRQQN